MEEFPVQRFLRDSHFSLIGGGAIDIMKIVIAKPLGS